MTVRHRREMMFRCWRISLLTIGVALSRGDAQATAELRADQRKAIEAGGQVFRTWEVPQSSWPRACVYERIDATPEEAAAVFVDYERHRSFIPGITKSTISRVVDPATAEVDYTLDVPIVADEHYTVRDRVSVDSGSGSYQVDWSLVRASSTKATVGGVRFEPFRADGDAAASTLMAYCNLVTPGSRLAKLGFIKSRAMKQVRETAHAVATEVRRERTTDRALLDAQLTALRAALRASTP